MLTREQNELLTHTGPGTPGGEMMRRYWQPVALVEELPTGSPPLPVRLLGEDLVLYRDESGHPGLLGIHCAHRGADLSYGRLEDGGIRCIYHGWLYDRAGRCLEQPGEPAGSTFYQRIRQTAYPCVEQAGLIMAYLGPGEPPLVPNYPHLTAPDDRRITTKVHRESNYLQGNEGNIDSVHLQILHMQQPRWRPNPGFDIIQNENTNYGIRNYWIRRDGDRNYVHITGFVMPSAGAFNGGGAGHGEGYSVNWHVPEDDTHHWEYSIHFRYEQPDPEQWRRQAQRADLGDNYHLSRHIGNRYQQDREEMRTRTFAGLGTNFWLHDACATETAGPIQDRTQENLGFGDKAIVAARLMLLQAIEDVRAGRDPVGVVRDPAANAFEILTRGEEIPADVDWRTYWRATERTVVGAAR